MCVKCLELYNAMSDDEKAIHRQSIIDFDNELNEQRKYKLIELLYEGHTDYDDIDDYEYFNRADNHTYSPIDYSRGYTIEVDE